MQKVSPRIIKRRFKHWVFVFRTALIIFTIVLVGYSLCFDFKINNNEMTTLKSNELDTTPTIHVQTLAVDELPKLSKENQLEMDNYTIHVIEGKNVNDPTTFYNVNLKHTVKELNAKQTIRNLDKYGPLTNDSLIIVIQVHTRIQYLRETIYSLSKARGIEDIILIFSHDYYDIEINNFINGLDFCKTMQIFFPYSSQIYTKIFPGQSPNDCPSDITRDEAMKMNCINAKNPDQNGVYRNSNTTQPKHHWWWKMNMVFDQLRVVRNYTGLIVFIEEDHYMVEDFIHVLKVMQRTCPRSKIFSLGVHSKYIFSTQTPKMIVSPWIENLAMSFNRSVWNELVQCAKIFCYYDDYNWDWSLQKMTKVCHNHKFLAATLQNSRIYHIGTCGMHHSNNCTDMSHVTKLKQDLMSINLYPDVIEVIYVNYYSKVGSGWGGWGDPRDHKLCMSMIHHHVNT